MIFTFSFPVTLTIVTLDLKFPPLVTLVPRHVSTKLELSFYGFPISRKLEAGDGQTDGCGQHINPPPGDGHMYIFM